MVVERGTQIPDNADLDDYYTVGKFYSNSNETTATLLNVPDGVTVSFSLYVLAESSAQRKQILISNLYEAYIYMRQRSQAGTWGPWELLTPKTAHPDITDVFTPANDITIANSYVTVRDKLVVVDCTFSQTSTTKTNRFVFKEGYMPEAALTNISPIFTYSNNVVSDVVLFINAHMLTIFGATPVSGQSYYFRLIYVRK